MPGKHRDITKVRGLRFVAVGSKLVQMKSWVLVLCLPILLASCTTQDSSSPPLSSMPVNITNSFTVTDLPLELYCADSGLTKRFYFSYTVTNQLKYDNLDQFFSNAPASIPREMFVEPAIYCANSLILYTKGVPLPGNVAIDRTEIISGDPAKEQQSKNWGPVPGQFEYCADCFDLGSNKVAFGFVTNASDHVHHWVPLTPDNWAIWYSNIDRKLKITEKMR